MTPIPAGGAGCALVVSETDPRPSSYLASWAAFGRSGRGAVWSRSTVRVFGSGIPDSPARSHWVPPERDRTGLGSAVTSPLRVRPEVASFLSRWPGQGHRWGVPLSIWHPEEDRGRASQVDRCLAALRGWQSLTRIPRPCGWCGKVVACDALRTTRCGARRVSTGTCLPVEARTRGHRPIAGCGSFSWRAWAGG